MAKFRFNKIIKVLIASDLAYQIGAGLVGPVFAIFLLESIENGSAQVAGTAAAIYWLSKSILRLPVAWFLDKNRGEYDDYYSMISGFLIITAGFFLYIFAKTPMHIYLIQFLTGIGGALAFTPWYGFFSRHIDKYHENFEWGVEVSLVGFGIAGAGFAAGIIADRLGFMPLFAMAGCFSLAGTLLFLITAKHIKLKKTDGFTIEKKT